MRAAAASAHQALLGLASTQLGVPTSQLSVSKGVVSGGGKTVTYGQLIGGKLFNVTMPASWNMNPTASGGLDDADGLVHRRHPAGQSPAKPVSQYTLVGTRAPRIDIPAIVTGTATSTSRTSASRGCCTGGSCGRAGRRVFGFGAPIVSVDESSIAHITGAQIVRKGNFLGVVAPHEYDAIQAAAQLKVKWADPPAALPGGGNEFEAHARARRRRQDGDDEGRPRRGLAEPRATSTRRLPRRRTSSAESYGWPTNIHTPIGPQCAVADVTPQGARIFSGTQGAYQTRPQVALVLGLPENQVRITAVRDGRLLRRRRAVLRRRRRRRRSCRRRSARRCACS